MARGTSVWTIVMISDVVNLVFEEGDNLRDFSKMREFRTDEFANSILYHINCCLLINRVVVTMIVHFKGDFTNDCQDENDGGIRESNFRVCLALFNQGYNSAD